MLNITNASWNTTTEQYGTAVDIVCDPGYQFRWIDQVALQQLGQSRNNTATVVVTTCNSTGQWSISPVVCQRKSSKCGIEN